MLSNKQVSKWLHKPEKQVQQKEVADVAKAQVTDEDADRGNEIAKEGLMDLAKDQEWKHPKPKHTARRATVATTGKIVAVTGSQMELMRKRWILKRNSHPHGKNNNIV